MKLLPKDDRRLVRRTKRKRLKGLDEEELLSLHDLVRRGRDMYVKLHRRASRSRVTKRGGRAVPHAHRHRSAARAEAFETALARVSQALAKAAGRSAAHLRAEARAEKSAAQRSGGRGSGGRKQQSATASGASR